MTEENLSSLSDGDVRDERRVYELGYLAVSTLSESELATLVDSVKRDITTRGGSIISEDAPQELELAYTMYTREKEKNIPHTKAFFGSYKFEIAADKIAEIKQIVDGNKLFIRSLIFVTVAEDTRAKVPVTALREVKATGTIAAPKKQEETARASESELDKTVDSIVADLV
jgi:ribosomal protein S6